VLINKLERKQYKMLVEKKEGLYDTVVVGLMDGLRTKSPYFHFKARDEQLDDEENAVPELDENFSLFMENVPTVEITPEEVKAIAVDEYDAMEREFETRIRELSEDKELIIEKMKRQKQKHAENIAEVKKRNAELLGASGEGQKALYLLAVVMVVMCILWLCLKKIANEGPSLVKAQANEVAKEMLTETVEEAAKTENSFAGAPPPPNKHASGSTSEQARLRLHHFAKRSRTSTPPPRKHLHLSNDMRTERVE
jgi:hypothetical protein